MSRVIAILAINTFIAEFTLKAIITINTICAPGYPENIETILREATFKSPITVFANMKIVTVIRILVIPAVAMAPRERLFQFFILCQKVHL
jgi:hypothetical protein